MSEYIGQRANKHRVIHQFSGKRHFFKVMSNSGLEHNVSIELKCDCRYMSVQGEANGSICSHSLAVLDRISDACHAGTIISMNGGEDILQMKRNACLNLIRNSNRHIGIYRASPNESPAHLRQKETICNALAILGKQFVTEAIFKSGGIADVLCLDDFTVYEIVNTESEESIEEKRSKYPKGLKIEVVRCGKI